MIWTLKLFKAFGGRVTKGMWSNTYLINSNNLTIGIEDPAWLELVNQIGVNERAIHLSQTHFMRATLSSAREEAIYDPKMLRVFELQGTGNRGTDAGQSPIPLDLAMKVKKNVSYGRSGTMFFRGCLNTNEMTIGAGGAAALKTPIDSWLTIAVDGWITALANELTALDGSVVMPAAAGLDEGTANFIGRNVQSYTISGLSVNRRDHRYFDTAASPLFFGSVFFTSFGLIDNSTNSL